MRRGYLLRSMAMLLLVMSLAAAMAVRAQEEDRTGITELRFDIAEDGAKFVFAPSPVFEDGMPAYGNSFVTQGYIYPEGTLNGSNGVLPNGEPEFPDLVLGQWTCKGWFVGEGMRTTEGPWAVTTQIFQFGEEYGSVTIVTEGYEGPELNAVVSRAVLGGTGDYSGARGEQTQELLGFTEQMGVNLRVGFQLIDSE